MSSCMDGNIALTGCADVLKTALQACSTQANTAAFWQRLPLPVQQAAPFVGAATLSALIVNRIGSAKLRAEVSCENLLWSGSRM